MTKAFTLTKIIQVVKKNILFEKPKFCTFREVLIFQSHSTDGKCSNSKPNASVKLDIINWQNVKNKRSISDLGERFTFHFHIRVRKLLKASESKNRDGQQLNGNFTVPRTKKHPGKPWFSKLTSEEIILGTRTRFNI